MARADVDALRGSNDEDFLSGWDFTWSRIRRRVSWWNYYVWKQPNAVKHLQLSSVALHIVKNYND